jgi:hypothetical protein
MDPLGPLLIYMIFGLPYSAEQRIHHSLFDPVESRGEAGPGWKKSTATGSKLAAFSWESTNSADKSAGHDGGLAAEEIGSCGVKIGRIRPRIGRARDGGSAGQEIGGGGVKIDHIRSGIGRLSP